MSLHADAEQRRIWESRCPYLLAECDAAEARATQLEEELNVARDAAEGWREAAWECREKHERLLESQKAACKALGEIEAKPYRAEEIVFRWQQERTRAALAAVSVGQQKEPG